MSNPTLAAAEDPRIDAIVRVFETRYGHRPACVSDAPGRVNLIGEHTDYNDGFVFPAAINRSTLVAAAPSPGRKSRIWSANFDEEVEFDAVKPDRRTGERWDRYVRGSSWSLARAGYESDQVDLALESNVPLGAGLSSSAALEVATVAVLAAIQGAQISALDVARIAHRAETEFVGVPCGIMDQFASALAIEGSAMLIDCRSQATQNIPLGLAAQGVSIVVVESGVSRELAGSGYRDRREECREACRFLRGPLARPLTSLRDVTMEDLAVVGDQLPKVLLRRARHVVSENSRVLQCVSALRAGHLAEVGQLMAESHRSLRSDYEVSCSEIDLLVELASGSDQVVGARLTGAGFGGSTVNLVRTDGIKKFEHEVLEEYRSRTGRRASMHVCRAAAGVRVLDL